MKEHFKSLDFIGSRCTVCDLCAKLLAVRWLPRHTDRAQLWATSASGLA